MIIKPDELKKTFFAVYFMAGFSAAPQIPLSVRRRSRPFGVHMIDLHMHSTCSDGTLTPEELVAAALDLGLEAAALEELRITEPVYPSYLPDGFTLAEAYVSQDPLLLYELYTRGDRFLSITVTSVSASVMALYPSEELSSQKYEAGETAHYLFSNDGSITAVWYTENCFVSISGNIAIRLMKRIIDSVYA